MQVDKLRRNLPKKTAHLKKVNMAPKSNVKEALGDVDGDSANYLLGGPRMEHFDVSRPRDKGRKIEL